MIYFYQQDKWPHFRLPTWPQFNLPKTIRAWPGGIAQISTSFRTCRTPSLNDRHKVLAEVMAKHAYSLLQSGKLDDSLSAYEKLFTLLEQSKTTLPVPQSTSAAFFEDLNRSVNPLKLDGAIDKLQEACSNKGKAQVQKGLAIYERLINYNNPTSAPNKLSLDQLGSAKGDFNKLAETFEREKDNTKAALYYRKAADLAGLMSKKSPATDILFAQARENLLDFFIRHNDMKQAREVAEENLKLMQGSSNPLIIAVSYVSTAQKMGDFFLKNGNKEEADRYFGKALLAKDPELFKIHNDVLNIYSGGKFIGEAAKAFTPTGKYESEAEKLRRVGLDKYLEDAKQAEKLRQQK